MTVRLASYARSVLVLLFVGCGSLLGLEDGKLEGDSCTSNDDCHPKHVCLRDRCLDGCQLDEDCGTSGRCLTTPLGSACVPFDLLACGGDAECGPGAVCHDGECRTTCEAGCRSDQRCVGDVCVGVDEAMPGAGGQGTGGQGTGAQSAGGNGSGADTSSGGGGNEPGNAGASAGGGPGGGSCSEIGVACVNGDSCCSGFCDAVTGSCGASVARCRASGEACSQPTDCCTLVCSEGSCGATQCVSDGGDCGEGSECCSGQCLNQKCLALSTECSTSGNGCTVNGDCCSGWCEGDVCKLNASFCIQTGDVCARDHDCCSGSCDIEGDNAVGLCAPPESVCGVDGEICDGCGECCSNVCAPHGPSGVSICQPSGCHGVGESCRRDEDCCGGATDDELPGYSNGRCDIPVGGTVGRCSVFNGPENPDGACNPQGGSCEYPDYECSASAAVNNCCGSVGMPGGVRARRALPSPLYGPRRLPALGRALRLQRGLLRRRAMPAGRDRVATLRGPARRLRWRRRVLHRRRRLLPRTLL